MKKIIKTNPKHESLFFKAIVAIRSEKTAKQFMFDLCTPTELQAMIDRFRVVDFILQGMSYRQIHDKTGISVTTIGRVARTLMLGKGGYQLIKNRLKRK